MRGGWKTSGALGLQPTNSNVKLLQCYGIFLTSLNNVRNDLAVKITSQRNQCFDLLCKSIYCFLDDTSLHWKLFANIL